MTKLYGFKFGSGKASVYTGLTPTFTIFAINGISAIAAPGVTETPASSGLYQFQFGPTLPIIFEIDGTSSISALSDRYVYGSLDPLQRMDEYGNTLIAQGVSIIAITGSTASSFGTTAINPSDLFGMLKRLQEFNEGNATYTKSTNLWAIFSRGSSTQIASKTLSNNTTLVTKT